MLHAELQAGEVLMASGQGAGGHPDLADMAGVAVLGRFAENGVGDLSAVGQREWSAAGRLGSSGATP